MKLQFSDIIERRHTLWREDDNQQIVLLFIQDHFIQRLFRKIFRLKIAQQSDIILDEKTSIIWKLIDGEKTVQEIFDQFQNNVTEEMDNNLEARFGTVIHYFLSQKWIQVKER